MSEVTKILGMFAIVASVVAGFIWLAESTEPDRYAGDTESEAYSIATAAIVNQCPTKYTISLKLLNTEKSSVAAQDAWKFSFNHGIKTYAWYKEYGNHDYSLVIGC